MLTIRLSRTGKKKQPYYRIVLQEKTRDPWSPAIEVLGTLNPRADRKDAVLEKERIAFWLAKGAQPSDTLNNLFIDHGLVKGDKRNKITITEARKKKMAAAVAAAPKAA